MLPESAGETNLHRGSARCVGSIGTAFVANIGAEFMGSIRVAFMANIGVAFVGTIPADESGGR